MPRRISNSAQFGIDSPWMIAPCRPKRLPNPFRDGHSLTTGNALNLSVFLLIEEDLQSLWHNSSILD